MAYHPRELIRAARADGYRPIADALWVWAMAEGSPPEDIYRLVTVAGRYLDSAHLQIERVREAIDLARSTDGAAGPTSRTLGRQAAYQALGDSQLAVIALDKAFEVIVDKLSGVSASLFRCPQRFVTAVR